MTDQNANDSKFDRDGPARVRLLIQTGGYGRDDHPNAIRWLAAHDTAAYAAEEASKLRQERSARSTLCAAWIAAAFAVVGAVVSAAALIHSGH